MVDERTADGVRIAQLLASELDAGGAALGPLSVVDARPDVEPTADGALAYRVVARTDGTGTPDGSDDGSESDAGGEPLAAVYVHPDRARVEFVAAPDAAATAGEAAGLRVRPKAVRPPRTLVFVEDGAEAKRVLAVFEAVVRTDVDGEDG